MTDDLIINKIQQLVDERFDELKVGCTTYEELMKKARSHRLAYKHGDLGKAIDNIIFKKINQESITQSIQF